MGKQNNLRENTPNRYPELRFYGKTILPFQKFSQNAGTFTAGQGGCYLIVLLSGSIGTDPMICKINLI
jgi:hypothetical protein